MSENLGHMSRQLAAQAAIVALGLGTLGGSAEANTGGATFNNQPAIQNQKSHGACPASEKITSQTSLSAPCRTFLMGSLRQSVYDDPSDMLSVATYQKLAGLKAVDGALGPITAKSILSGKALRLTSPDRQAGKKEMLIDKSLQVAYMLGNGSVKHVFSVSSGREHDYSELGKDGKIHQGSGHTPTGTFRVYDSKPADYTAPLGAMPYARFFTDKAQTIEGFAVHAGTVDPAGRASHGCVRLDRATVESVIVKELNIGDTVKIQE